MPILREEAIYREFLLEKVVESLFFKYFILKIEGPDLILDFLTGINTALYSIIYARNTSSISSRAHESLLMRLCFVSKVEHRVLQRFQESLFP